MGEKVICVNIFVLLLLQKRRNLKRRKYHRLFKREEAGDSQIYKKKKPKKKRKKELLFPFPLLICSAQTPIIHFPSSLPISKLKQSILSFIIGRKSKNRKERDRRKRGPLARPLIKSFILSKLFDF